MYQQVLIKNYKGKSCMFTIQITLREEALKKIINMNFKNSKNTCAQINGNFMLL